VELNPARGNRKWDIPAHQEYSIELEVVSLPGATKPAYLEGWKFRFTLWYIFAEYYEGVTPTGTAYFHGSNRDIERNQSFLSLAGVPLEDEGFNIPFSDNVLPFLEEIIPTGKKAPIFQTQIENSWLAKEPFGPAPE
jgi:hypothetical protein